ncbi:DNA-binding transcriptional regulator, AcrR family [Saccharopolyspora antimicrobica]|uniref:DNA-binding transcriptional regulator, AcrR family n=1 Tax=Saccharopolyspora antimicrobica TaxID=455193 RepID=A0A1I4YYC4_9PSEU|nr:TetR family transcriptional regulator [Saccharopolyspora antimicrobica]RKT82854.1 TetR family transcriptional regulator [Saccharopolyspora antimicrobica]SFN42783.1 DNA-binding transcriptional regulator, AcrR family [Saccharopolyspora antimicrobica]
MRANFSSAEQSRSFTEQGRRAQIVAAAIEAIVELGYPRASFGQIAKRAGLSSTGMISYHFKNKAELMRQVVADVYRTAEELVGARVVAADTARGQLRAFIEASADFYRTHHPQLRALTEILINERGGDPVLPHRHEIEGLAELFRAGQRAGEFRDFDPHVMAVTLRHALDGVALRLGTEADTDTDLYARELATTFDLATRASQEKS